ncbi:unnamed protein product (mitochondrion) [Plasmodiophora brassicae]|uniref:GrpE protein homolog n=2 Tax=Plasmodiophora brassicae TaxID=37360 RepID=A0A3P3YCP3_PLABS|nr:unnamed protein product [Plasmodiophora brassicae]
MSLALGRFMRRASGLALYRRQMPVAAPIARMLFSSATNGTPKDAKPNDAAAAAATPDDPKDAAAGAAPAEGADKVAAGEEKQQTDAETSSDAREDEMAQMADLISEKDEEILDIKEKLYRALAEMENVRHRSKRDVDNAYKYSITGFAKDLLEVSDNLNRALENVDRHEAAKNAPLKSLLEGLELTESGLRKAFGKHGVEQMHVVVGETPFNPHSHNALFEEPTTTQTHGTIAKVIIPGFMFKDRVLRSAGVATYKNPNGPAKQADTPKQGDAGAEPPKEGGESSN